MCKKSILVTGASRGIGRAIALKFAQKGYNVAINCIHNKEKLLDVQKEIESHHVECLAYVGDMGNVDDCQKLFSKIQSTWQSLDVLVNNAGISYIGLLQDMSEDEWNHMINNNLTSVFHCSKLAIPLMLKENHGKIINISSVWGVCGASCEVAYSATKGAINSFTKALAKELAPSNIQVNAIACGAIDTDMNSCFSDQEITSLTEEIPAGRLGLPEEVADFVYHLGYKGTYLTGQVIQMDGGWI